MRDIIAILEGHTNEGLEDIMTQRDYNELKADFAGETIVKGFESHDHPDWWKSGEHFADLYTVIFEDVEEVKDPEVAGHMHKAALFFQDIIEDGLEDVEQAIKDSPDPYMSIPEEIRRKAVENESKDVVDNVLWNEVYHSFEAVGENLGINEELSQGFVPHSSDFQFEWEEKLFAENQTVNAFGYLQTLFYALHTEMTRIQRDPEYESRFEDFELRARFREAAFTSQSLFFSKLSGLDKDSYEVTELSMNFLYAVDSHDTHTPEEQLNNIERMKDTYLKALNYRTDLT